MAKHRSRTPAEQRAREVRAVVDLLNDAERATAAVRLGLASDSTARDVADALARSPRADSLCALVAAAPDVIDMLKDIGEWLEQHGVSARTTGFMLALDGLANTTGIDLSAQEIDLACSWPARLDHTTQDSFAQLLRDWRKLARHWSSLLDHAMPHRTRPSIDPVRSVVEGRSVDKRRRDGIDETARSVLSHFLERLTRTIGVLERMTPNARTEDVQQLLVRLHTEAKAATAAVSTGPRVKRMRERALAQALRRYRVLDQGLSRFHEDLLASALLREAVASDLFRLDLWRHRPQLYEVWVLISILRSLEDRGYVVEPLEVTEVDGDRARWQLRYANASKPCASIQGDGALRYVFYQLFRRPEKDEAADMPDISLLDGPSPTDSAVWAVDPKHSDRKAYRLGDYQLTGTRYASSFGAALAVVVEYYSREDLPDGNPYPLGRDAILVKDASPRGTGMPMVLQAIGPFHRMVARTVLCVDASASFDNRRAEALKEFRASIAGAGDTHLSDEFVWFAGSACVAGGGVAFAAGADLPDAPTMEPGTALQPLIDVLRPLLRPGSGGIALVGDGEFDLSSWQVTLERSLGTSVSHHP